jgi:hypothetical protein
MPQAQDIGDEPQSGQDEGNPPNLERRDETEEGDGDYRTE